ncbi:unnamed protein product [Adineta steineri]|uniref:Uncharacterized protein n=1 Tax=Adineta steineri TaxID=433720 RepID=A0A814QQQ3_9BILA|nr:unnamed protein product [Adineta steineri]CAF1402432.1 unnamed protein product [Adineta steineri]
MRIGDNKPHFCGNRSTFLTFDDLSSGEAILNGYNGINLNNAYALINGFVVSGYSTGTVNGNLTMFNGGETPMTMTGANGALFTLNSAGVIVNNTFIHQVLTVSYITFKGYSGLDAAVFSTSGGTINPIFFWRSWSICNG